MINNNKTMNKLLKTFKKGRPTFYYKNDPANQIRAGGLILYRVTTDKNGKQDLEYLMIKWNGVYEDFGGKTDKEDMCYQDTVLRETEEESNGILNLYRTYKPVMNNEPVFYKECKYLTYVLKADIEYYPEEFDDIEYYENVARTVEWVPHSTLITKKFTKHKLHTRLLFREFFDKLRYIHNQEIKKHPKKNHNKNKFKYQKKNYK